MADFLDSEAEESDQSEEEEVEPQERKKLEKLKAVQSDSSEEEEDNEEQLREEMKDLIDDNPIESDADSDASEGGHKKRKKSDDEDELDDRLEDDDYDLIEENLGVKVERKKFKRLRRVEDEDSDNEEADESLNREVIADQLFHRDGSDEEEDHRSERSSRQPALDLDNLDEEEGDEESDPDDFIVDDDGNPVAAKKKKKPRVFTDASLQEGQDIFGVDFDYDEFDKYEEESYDDESEADEYEEEDGEAGRERRQKKTAKKRIAKKSIFDIYEPSELKRGHFTDLDNEIRKTDMPERMQLRDVPISSVPEGSSELEDEAEWIYKQAFVKPSISSQTATQSNDLWGSGPAKKPSSTIGKIKQALDFMRNQQLEVPFIAFYRKEYVQPELTIADLWRVYKFDARWCQLEARKKQLVALFMNMQSYQTEKLMENPDASIPDEMRLVKDEDIDRVRAAQTQEELKDIHHHFILYCAWEIPAMREWSKLKERQKRRLARIDARAKALQIANDEGIEPPPEDPLSEDEVEAEDETLKLKMDSGSYSMCRKAGLAGMAKKFGLSPEHYAENLRSSYQRHEVEQEPLEPTELAKQFTTARFQTVEDVMYAAKFMVAKQISREPMLRKTIREIYFERAKISVAPTKQGIKEIDENHACYTMKYLKDKPVRELTRETFLKLHIAEEHKLLTVTLHEKVDTNSATTFLEDAKALYNRDEFAKHVQDWNALRSECVELAITKMVLPDLRKELHAILLNEAREFVLKEGCKKLFDWLKVAPYSVSFPDEDEYDWDTSKGVRVMALAYVPDYSQAAFCAIVSPDGEITDHLRLPNILKRKGSFWEDERELKNADLSTVTHFIRVKKPHVIVIGGESREATMVRQDLQECIQKLHDDEQFPLIAVEIIDNELSKIYANSQKGTADFRDYPNLLRQAVSLARRTQDPLIEFSQLCTADEEITCLRFHTLQEHLQKEEFLENLYIEFINRTNEVGVDVNLAVQNPLTVNLVQFICGLGPRKGQALIKILKQTNQRLENRTQLVTVCHMGPKVFINCSGFIKIDTNSLGDSTEAYVEVLDGSRVHPETYEWARKMAVDALEYDDEDANPAGALEEILETPERLKDLDLDAFAEELERQGFGNKSITLYDIRSELNSRYKDLRVPWRPLNSEELFDVLTKETPDSFYIGKLVLGTVIAIAHKKPQGDILDQANPVRNEESGLWQCPFCLKNDFPELGEVWSHFDTGDCVGQATGVKLKLDNGLLGYIPIKNLSDSHVKNPEERVHTGQAIHVRVTKIEVDRFSCDCTSKSSDLADRSNEWRPRKDEYYDNAAEERDMKAEEAAKKHKERTQYVKRVIVHPAFMNKSYTETLRIMASKEQGDVIIRPSSKGSDHLTVTWKVVDDIYQHIDVREEGKENAFTLGKSLWIGNEDFEDLDEIIARHINPMASFARDLLSYKYYRDTQGGSREKAEAMLKEEKQKNPSKIHYIVSACKAYPGKFLLSYLPRLKPKHEFITVTPDGLRYRGQLFDSINSLLKWFKEHYRDPIPNATPQMATPRGSISSRSPYTIGTSSINNETIKKVAQNMPAHMLNSLSAVTNTPHYTPGTTYGGASSYVNTPYTPSGQTPFLSGMTPYHTPHHSSQTPRYGQQTPSQMGKSPFLHPSAAMPPGAGARGGMMPPPGGFAPSPRSSPHMRSGGFHPPGQENASWARATEAWGSGSRSHSSRTPQAYGSGHQRDPYAQPPPAVGYSNSRGTPRSDYNRGARPPGGREHGHGGGSRTPRGNSTPRSDYGGRSQHQMGAKSPGSVRTASTPKTNTSPKSMNLGDQTPLWDED